MVAKVWSLLNSKFLPCSLELLKFSSISCAPDRLDGFNKYWPLHALHACKVQSVGGLLLASSSDSVQVQVSTAGCRLQRALEIASQTKEILSIGAADIATSSMLTPMHAACHDAMMLAAMRAGTVELSSGPNNIEQCLRFPTSCCAVAQHEKLLYP